jgi:lipoate-protein ligase A
MMWRFLNTGFHHGAFNMEFDESLALQLKDSSAIPILRVYGWSPYAISLGFNQNIQDFDSPKITQAGIDIIRRPTGGRAILHAHELTYSIVMKLDNRGPRDIYHFINEGLLCGLKYMGIEAQLSDQNDNFRKLYQDNSSIPCFSSSAKSEIQFEGRKLVGSAQRRYGNVILQHGSLLLGPEHRRITEYLASHIQHARDIIVNDLTTRTSDAETILGRSVLFEEAADCIRHGFEKQCNIIFEDLIVNESIKNENSIVSSLGHENYEEE